MNDSGVPWLSTDGLRRGTDDRGGATVSPRIEPAAGRSVWPQTLSSPSTSGAVNKTAADRTVADLSPSTAHTGQQGGPTSPDAERQVDRTQVEDALARLSRSADLFNKRLQFRIHEQTDRLIVRVVDKETEEVIREIPPERILDLVASIEAFLGLLFDERV